MQTFTFSLPQINLLLYSASPLKTEALFKKKKKKEVTEKGKNKKKRELKRRRKGGEAREERIGPEGPGESQE